MPNKLAESDAARTAALKQAAEAIKERDNIRQTYHISQEVGAASEQRAMRFEAERDRLAKALRVAGRNARRIACSVVSASNEYLKATAAQIYTDAEAALAGTPVENRTSLVEKQATEELGVEKPAPATFADGYRAGLEAAADTPRSFVTDQQQAKRLSAYIRALPVKEGPEKCLG